MKNRRSIQSSYWGWSGQQKPTEANIILIILKDFAAWWSKRQTLIK